MKVQLDRVFPVPSADAAWTLLQDVEAVAQCMPGAAISQRIDERHFKGTVSLRFGPASMVFRGEVEVGELDPVTRTLRMAGKGTDSTGTSGASMELTARIEQGGDGARLVGAAEVSVNGKAAAFGARMIGAVADQVLKQFAANLAARLAPPPAAAAGASPEAQPRPLNGLALMWSVLKAWVRTLFGGSAA